MPSFRLKSAGLALLLFCTSVFAGELREIFEKTYPLQAQGRFSLENANGVVQIAAWDRNEVKIVAEKIARAGRESEAQRLLEATEIVVREAKNDIEVYTRAPKTGGDSFWGWMFGEGSNHVTVNYTITVPREIYLKIISVNGKIDAREISGKAELQTTNGGIEVEDAEGSISAETTNGRIMVSLREVARGESMHFETTNGSVTAEFPRDFNAKISARTTNGSVRCDFPLTMENRSSRHSLEGRIGDSGGNVTLRTTKGSIAIRQRS
ncbi:MAG: DUF4097 family beta strand repeat-containing protein [candidate division KSB1 bacterium]